MTRPLQRFRIPSLPIGLTSKPSSLILRLNPENAVQTVLTLTERTPHEAREVREGQTKGTGETEEERSSW